MKIAIPLIGFFIFVDLYLCLWNIYDFYVNADKNHVNERSKLEFSISYAVSKVLMICAPVPFIVISCGCAEDSFNRRRMLFKAICYNVIPTELATCIVLIIAISLEWIKLRRFLQSFIPQFFFFVIYLYFTGILKRYADEK